MACVTCNGAGCRACDGKGMFEITKCPLELITHDVWKIIKFAELYEKGLPPVAGGALDQAVSFVDAASFIFAEQNYWKKKLGIFD